MNAKNKPIPGQLIDWAHPMSNGLVFCSALNAGYGVRVVDDVRNRRGLLINGATWKAGDSGPAVLTDGSNDYIDFEGSSDPTLDFGAGDFSVFFRVNKLAASIAFSNFWAITKWNSSGSHGSNEWYTSLGSNSTGNTNNPSFGIELSTTTYFVDALDALTIGNFCSVGAKRVGTTLTIYVNGKKSNTATCGSGAITNRGRSVLVANSAANVLQPNAVWDQLRLYKRALSDSDFATLHAQPNEIYVPLRRRTYSIPATATLFRRTMTNRTGSRGAA